MDQQNIFRFAEHHDVHARYSLGMDEGQIQFKRALRSLDIGLIYASKGAGEAVSLSLCKTQINSVCEAQKVVEEVESFLQHSAAT